MAKLSSDGKYVTVEKGDTLSGIAAKYGNGTNYQTLAAINKIENPNYIVVGQKIYLKKETTSGSDPKPPPKKTSSNKVTIKHFGIQSDTERTMYVSWEWTKANTANYRAIWYYHTGDGVWFVGDDSTVSVRQSLYTVPSNATKVRFKVKPIAKKHKVNNKDTYYWTAEWTTYKEQAFAKTIETPGVPTVSIDGYQLKAELDNLYIDATSIEFNIVKNDKTNVASLTSKISTLKYASIVRTISPGAEYKVRCRAIKGSLKSDWSDYSANQTTIPAASKGIKSLIAKTKSEVDIDWYGVSSATKYEIQYTTKGRYFDSSDEVNSVFANEDSNRSHAEITGLEPGSEYFFRVRAVNDKGSSAWTAIKSIKIGVKPGIPTTWSSTTTAIVGEKVTLYWLHNSQDNSAQTEATLEISINGNVETRTVTGKTSSYELKTSDYTSGASITWRVRTQGILDDGDMYSGWSIKRKIDVFAPPALEFDLLYGETTVTQYPIEFFMDCDSNSNKVIGYHLSITAANAYKTVDDLGNEKIVKKNEEVFSKHYDVAENRLNVDLTPSDINLENNETYVAHCVVSVDSGLTAEASLNFDLLLDDFGYDPNAEISIDEDKLVAFIRPYCASEVEIIYEVKRQDNKYVIQDEIIDNAYGEIIPGVQAGTDENGIHDPSTGGIMYLGAFDVYEGVSDLGKAVYYSIVTFETQYEDVLLSVYRREYDGTFTEIEKDIDGDRFVTVVDMHPSLDYARYRIIAKSKTTGTINYSDLPGVTVGEKAVIIQWNEQWTPFDIREEDEMEEPNYAGSMLRLPYNIDVSESNQSDVSLVEYIGRKHPVSYYGTQLGVADTWNVEIEKSDKDTLYMLRRLKIWMGDVYVREPSGSGYWANISVSFSQVHKEMTIPVTLNIKRVEGGA